MSESLPGTNESPQKASSKRLTFGFDSQEIQEPGSGQVFPKVVTSFVDSSQDAKSQSEMSISGRSSIMSLMSDQKSPQKMEVMEERKVEPFFRGSLLAASNDLTRKSTSHLPKELGKRFSNGRHQSFKSDVLSISMQAQKLQEQRRKSIANQQDNSTIFQVKKKHGSASVSLSNDSHLIYVEALRLAQAEIEHLKKKLYARTIFQNMLVHDMRSPTTSAHDALIQISNLFSLSEAVEAKMENTIELLEEVQKTSHEDEDNQAAQDLKSFISEALAVAEGKQAQEEGLMGPSRRRNTSRIDWDGEFADFEDGIVDELEDSTALLKEMKVQSNVRVFDEGEKSHEVELTKMNSSPFVLKIDRGVQCSLGSGFVSAEDESLFEENQELRQRLKTVTRILKDQVEPLLSAISRSKGKQQNQRLAERRIDKISSQFLKVSLAANRELRENVDSLLRKQLVSQKMMTNLINELMDLAKLENNNFKLDMEWFNLIQILNEAMTMVLSQAQSKGVTITSRIESLRTLQHVVNVLGDKHRLMQVLVNFLTNAIKFSNESGQIDVEVKMLSKQGKHKKREISKELIEMIVAQNLDICQYSDSKEVVRRQSSTKKFIVWLQVVIRDQGCGISEEGLSKLFLDFGKLDENSNRNRQGTGLGLSICKKIIEQMGGSIETESELGKGTSFFINFKTEIIIDEVELESDPFIDEEERLAPEAGVILALAPGTKGSGIKTRLACGLQTLDENHSALSLLANQKSKHIETLTKYQRAIEDISDLKQIPANLAKNSQEFEKMIDKVDCLIAKKPSPFLELPVESAVPVKKMNNESILTFGDVMSDAARSNVPMDFDDSGNEGQAFEKDYFSVLIANDEPLQLQILEIIFTQLDFKVTLAENGLEAFNEVKKSIASGLEANWNYQPVLQFQQFDLVLLDLNMPITDGYEACQMIKDLYKNQAFFMSQLQKERKRRMSITGHPKLFPPLIVANTAHINEEAFKKTIEIGFDLCFTSLKAKQIREELIPLLEERQKEIDRNNQAMLINLDEEDLDDDFSDNQSLDSSSEVQKQALGVINNSSRLVEVLEEEGEQSEFSNDD